MHFSGAFERPFLLDDAHVLVPPRGESEGLGPLVRCVGRCNPGGTIPLTPLWSCGIFGVHLKQDKVMKQKGLRAIVFPTLLLVALPLFAQSSGDIEALKKEIQTIKEGQAAIQKDLQEIKKLLAAAQRPPQAPA